MLEKLKKNEDLRQTLSAIRTKIREDRGTCDIFLGDRDAIEALVKSLGCDDAKSRKSAALLIGELGLSGQDEYRSRLLDAYEKETTLFVRESYLKAIGEG
ncbi:MAG: hypothetical protein ACI4CS_03245, partial [Candidatus Weimeria sp.]